MKKQELFNNVTEFATIFPDEENHLTVFSSYFCNRLSLTYVIIEDRKMLEQDPFLYFLFPTNSYRILFPHDFNLIGRLNHFQNSVYMFIAS